MTPCNRTGLGPSPNVLNLLCSNSLPPVENETQRMREENEVIDLSIESPQGPSSALLLQDVGSNDEEHDSELINVVINRSTQRALILSEQEAKDEKKIKRAEASRKYLKIGSQSL